MNAPRAIVTPGVLVGNHYYNIYFCKIVSNHFYFKFFLSFQEP